MPVPDFSPGEVLTASAMDSIGLWLVKTQTIANGATTVTVSDAFSSNYDNYLIKVSGGGTSAGSNVSLRLGASTTSYYLGGYVGNYSSALLTALNDNNTSAWSRAGVGLPAALSVDIRLDNPFLSRVTLIKSDYVGADPTSAAGINSGLHNVATSYTAFTLFPSGAGVSFTGGTIRVYGFRN